MTSEYYEYTSGAVHAKEHITVTAGNSYSIYGETISMSVTVGDQELSRCNIRSDSKVVSEVSYSNVIFNVNSGTH